MEQLFSMSLSGPGRINQLGGFYVNGKPLPKDIREQIINLARIGVRPCDISRQLKITHGCISKLLSKYQKTGSINPGGTNVGRPKVITPHIERKIDQYRREQPGIFSWELRDRLLRENVCSRERLPSLSSISRLIKRKMMTGSKNTGSKEENVNRTFLVGQKEEDEEEDEEEEKELKLRDKQDLLTETNGETSLSEEDQFGLRRRRRQRAKYTSRQIFELEMEFERNPYPNAWDREGLANKLDIHETRIQVWFSNRRAKGKRRPYLQGETRASQPSPSMVCTCHMYPTTLPSRPWMVQARPSGVLIPSKGFWDYEYS
ncbi:paired box protein Pax-7-like [Porites lutea]|uniref:paired box protein Pax-7-like n=1 Tax=Porites lutea TaxID=51062 RepID=UPI003CC5492D